MIERVVQYTPQNHQRRSLGLVEYAVYLSERFEGLGDFSDLERSIQVSKEAMTLEPKGGPFRSLVLGGLAQCLLARSAHSGTFDDIDLAIGVTEEALSLVHDESSLHYSVVIGNLGCMLHQKFLRDGNTSDLDRAIQCTETAIKVLREARLPLEMVKTQYRGVLFNYGSYLHQKYKRSQNLQHLEQAITSLKEAMILTPPSTHIDMSKTGVELADCLGKMYESRESVELLYEAVDVIEQATTALPADFKHPTRAHLFQAACELGFKLGNWFQMKGDIQSLNRAIELVDKSVKNTVNEPDYPRYLRELGCLVTKRYLQTREKSDLDYAAAIAQTALEASLPRTLVHADAHATLGMIYDHRSRLMQDLVYLDKAIDHFQDSIEHTPETEFEVANARKCSLASCLASRYKHHDREMEELNSAINLTESAINTFSTDDQNRSILMINLGNYIDRRYKLSRSREDAMRSVLVWKQTIAAVEILDSQHVERANCWMRLGQSYLTQASGDPSLVDEAICAFEECGRCDGGPPSIRIAALALATSEHAERGDVVSLEKALSCVRQAIELYPIVSIRGMVTSDKLEFITDIMGVGHLGAAITVLLGRSPYEALKLFEAGRGIISKSFTDLRTESSALEGKHPELASRFASVQASLEEVPQREDISALELVRARIHQGKYRSEMESQLRDLLHEIRAEVGFEDFLSGPTEKECLEAAKAGPVVVINPSIRMHAFLIQKHVIDVIELDDPKIDEMLARIRTKATSAKLPLEVLQWAWSVIARPVLLALGIDRIPQNGNWPHIWWIAGGQLHYMPFHAAGSYVSGAGENVIDRVVSSYSFSVTALIHGRRRRNLAPSLHDPTNALLVAMAQTPEASHLPFAVEELERVEKCLPALGLVPINTVRKCRGDVLSELKTCNTFHFAGHGHVELNKPSQSGLRLEDGILDLEDIMDHGVHRKLPWLGYLSACSTGESMVHPSPWVDEGLNLINSFQLAGFRHVIGTLWEVSDRQCVEIAQVFYQTIVERLRTDPLSTDFLVAFGLHTALREVRAAIHQADIKRDGTMKSKKGKNGNTLQAANSS
jgi:tetratricopeptide (TPR) repeat protein